MNCTKERCRPVSVFEELDRGLNQLVRGVLSAETQAGVSPPVTLLESADRYRMESDLPGVALEDVSVSVENYVLTISGQRKKTEIQDSAKVLLNERSVREFSRSIQLPKNADVKAVDAEPRHPLHIRGVGERPQLGDQVVGVTAGSGRAHDARFA